MVKKGSSSYRVKSAFKLDFVFTSVRHKEVGGNEPYNTSPPPHQE